MKIPLETYQEKLLGTKTPKTNFLYLNKHRWEVCLRPKVMGTTFTPEVFLLKSY